MKIATAPNFNTHYLLNLRQERLDKVKEEVSRPPNEITVTRTLHHHGFNFKDLTNVEKINLFI